MESGRMNRMEIARASEADVAEVAACWHAGWHQAHAEIVPAALVASRVPAEFDARTRAHLDYTWVARIEGRFAGFFMLDAGELYQFYVDAASQGRGVAGELMKAVEEKLAGRTAWLACSVGNARAAAFYEKAGWVRRGTERYEVEASEGPQEVMVWRYEKDLT